MRTIIVAAVAAALAWPMAARAQSDADLRNAAKDQGSVLTYGMDYSQQRFSPLKQISRRTVKRLVPAWTYSLENNTGEESQPPAASISSARPIPTSPTYRAVARFGHSS